MRGHHFNPISEPEVLMLNGTMNGTSPNGELQMMAEKVGDLA